MRNAAAYALPALLALLVAGPAAAAATGAVDAGSPALHALAHELLGELVETNTTHEFGSTGAAEKLAARFRSAGFPAQDVVVLAPPGHPTKGNVVVRLHGRGAGRPILYLCHLDVVEAKREDWSVDPFRLTERDGWLYGRGTIDMKGQDAAVAASLIDMAKHHIVPGRDLIVAFTADEEAGGDASGIKWLLQVHRPLVDAQFVVNPDGGEAGLKAGRRLYVAFQTSEKLFLSFRLQATGPGGHSSRPMPGNPVYRLAAALDRLSQLRFPVHLTETNRLYFAGRAGLEQGQVQSDMRAVGNGTADDAAIERLSAQPETNILLRTTCTATQLDGGQSESALPESARATLQCRVIPGETPASVEAVLRAQVADPQVVITTLSAATPAPESAPQRALMSEVEKVTASLWPGVIVLPQMSAGASDSMYTRAAGIPSYGIDGMFDDLDDERAHGRDERIGSAVFDDEIEFTYRLMRRLVR